MANQPPSLGSFKLEIMKGNRAITEVILSLIVAVLFCQVSHPPSKILDLPLNLALNFGPSDLVIETLIERLAC